MPQTRAALESDAALSAAKVEDAVWMQRNCFPTLCGSHCARLGRTGEESDVSEQGPSLTHYEKQDEANKLT